MVMLMKSNLVKWSLIFALGVAMAHGQQFSANCTDVKVEMIPDASKLDEVCTVTLNGSATYQRQYVGSGQTFIGTISPSDAQKLLDRKLAWVTFGVCYEAADQKPRKERKRARLDCDNAFRTAQPEVVATFMRTRARREIP